MYSCVQVNDIAFHPQHGTLATVGSDGKFSFWDKDARTKLKVRQKSGAERSCSTEVGSSLRVDRTFFLNV